jgi:hypothetical protein
LHRLSQGSGILKQTPTPEGITTIGADGLLACTANVVKGDVRKDFLGGSAQERQYVVVEQVRGRRR